MPAKIGAKIVSHATQSSRWLRGRCRARLPVPTRKLLVGTAGVALFGSPYADGHVRVAMPFWGTERTNGTQVESEADRHRCLGLAGLRAGRRCTRPGVLV